MKRLATSIRLDHDIEKRLAEVARSAGRTKAWFIRQAIAEYLEEWEDYHLALSRLEQEKEEIDIAEVRHRLRVED